MKKNFICLLVEGFSQWKPLSYISILCLATSFILTSFNAFAEVSQEKHSLEIKDWFALGSGCKGRDGQIGDIRMKLEENERKPFHYQVKFTKGSYELDSFKSVSSKPSFARECALRVAAYPPKGFRIANVTALSSVMISKDKGAIAGVKARLLTAKGDLGEKVYNFDKSLAVKEKKLELNLEPNIEGRQLLKEIPCGKPKIIGMDLQFMNEKDSYAPKVKIKPTEDHLATLQITLEKCSLNVEKKSTKKKVLG